MSTPEGYQNYKLNNFTPEMQKLFQQLISQIGPGAGKGLGFLSQLAGGEESAFEGLEAPAYASFNKTLGQIGSRYAGAGAQDSSSFQNSIAGAGQNLAQNLQSQRTGLQLGALQQLLGQSNQLLGMRPFENVLQPESNGSPDFMGLLGALLPQLLKLI